jgi:hypothetical protein
MYKRRQNFKEEAAKKQRLDNKYSNDVDNLFINFMVIYQPQTTFLKGFLTSLDIHLLKMTCSSLNERLSVSKSDIKCSNLYYLALVRAHYSLALWVFEAKYFKTMRYSGLGLKEERQERFKLLFLNTHTERDEIAQKTLLQLIIQTRRNGRSIKDGSVARSKNLNLLKWSQSLGIINLDCTKDKSNEYGYSMIATGSYNVEVLKWGVDDLGWKLPGYIARMALRLGCLPIFEYIVGKGKLDLNDKSLCSIAAEKKDLKLLKYLRQLNVDWNEKTLMKAALHGDYEMFSWALENGCELGVRNNIHWDMCEKAIIGGSLEILKLMRQHGCQWYYCATLTAIEYKRMDMFEWMIQNGCPST